MERFCSPPPDQVTPGKSSSSPPLLPCTYDKGEDRDPTDVNSVLKGRSILNGWCNLSLKRLIEEFELEDNKNNSSNKKLKLISPSSPGGAVCDEDDDEEEVDLDMPWIPSPINLPVRTSTLHFPSLITQPSPRSVSFFDEPLAAVSGVAVPRITLSARPQVRFQDHGFIPIQLNYEDEEEESPQGIEDEEEELHQGQPKID